jgi:hypothetical protein
MVIRIYSTSRKKGKTSWLIGDRLPNLRYDPLKRGLHTSFRLRICIWDMGLLSDV